MRFARRKGFKVAAAAAALTLLAACGSSDATPTDADGLWGTARGASEAVTTPLVDTSGQQFVLAKDLKGKVNLVFFGYTHCPDICLAVMGTLASTMKKLDDSTRDQVQVIFVTTDPARDTPQVLRKYLDRFDESFIGLTTDQVGKDGKPDVSEIVDVGLTYGIAIDKNPKLVSGGYDIIHQDQVSGVNPAGQVTTVWNRDVTQVELAYDLEKLVQE